MPKPIPPASRTATPAAKTAPPKYNKIEHGPAQTRVVNGNTYRTQTSTMIIPPGPMKNSRSTPEGARADAAMRNSARTPANDVGHRMGAQFGPDPKDRGNTFPQHSIQNRSGGAKHYVEQQVASAKKKDPSRTIKAKSTLLHQTNRPGYGVDKPIAERMQFTASKNGKTVSKTDVTFVQPKSSAERAVDRAAAQGKTLSKQEINAYHAQDRKNFGTTTKKDQERAARMRSEAGPSIADRRAMARQYAQMSKDPNSNVVPLRPMHNPGPKPKLP